jgi:hypothetical protein
MGNVITEPFDGGRQKWQTAIISETKDKNRSNRQLEMMINDDKI